MLNAHRPQEMFLWCSDIPFHARMRAHTNVGMNVLTNTVKLIHHAVEAWSSASYCLGSICDTPLWCSLSFHIFTNNVEQNTHGELKISGVNIKLALQKAWKAPCREIVRSRSEVITHRASIKSASPSSLSHHLYLQSLSSHPLTGIYTRVSFSWRPLSDIYPRASLSSFPLSDILTRVSLTQYPLLDIHTRVSLSSHPHAATCIRESLSWP